MVVTCTTSTFTVGGTITGLTGSGLVLTDSVSTHTASPAAHAASFTITPAVNSGATYTVTVTTQPTNPTQNCVVTAGSGTVTTANITSVVVTCTTSTFTVGGTITGLTGSGLVLTDSVSTHTREPGGARRVLHDHARGQ